MVKDSFEYAKEALIGKWARWITFIILALPFALIQFVFDPETLVNKTTGDINWAMVPWDQIAVLVIIGTVLGIFLAGYTARVLRGVNPAPDFDNWTGLFVDGLKLSIVWFLWFLPFLLIMLIGIGIAVLAITSGDSMSSMALTLILFLLLLLVGCIFLIIASLYSYLGSVRFARTGSIREGIRFAKISEMIRTMGWIPYLLALLVVFVVGVIFGMVTMILSIIPFIGWILVMIANPFFAIFSARYAMLVYEQGGNPPVAGVQE